MLGHLSAIEGYAAGGGGREGKGLAVGRDAEDQLAGRGAQAHPVVDASS